MNPLTTDQRSIVTQALAAYGARLTIDDRIQRRDGRTLDVRVTARNGRLQYRDAHGNRLLASGPATAAGVARFVESFWFWEATTTTTPEPQA